MRAKDLDVVRGLPLFDGMDEGSLAALTCGALLQRLPRDTLLFEEGDEADVLHVLLDGSAMLAGGHRTGQDTVIDIVKPGDCFVLAAVTADAPYLMSGKLLELSQVLMLPAAAFREQAASQPALARSVMGLLAGQCRGLVRQVKDLKLCSTTQRLAAFVLAHLQAHARARAEPAVDGATFELPFSKQVLASRLGMSPEHLSRAFAKLSEHDLRMRGRTIQVGSIERLSRCCPQHAA